LGLKIFAWVAPKTKSRLPVTIAKQTISSRLCRQDSRPKRVTLLFRELCCINLRDQRLHLNGAAIGICVFKSLGIMPARSRAGAVPQSQHDQLDITGGALSHADRRVQLGPHLTQGLGAGAKPEIGRAAAEEATEELARHIEGVHMIFITAGMGGGTGTGAAPVITRMARERGILTVGVVTKPFDFEGTKRRKSADQGIEELQQFVDTLIIIPNHKLFRLANERTTFQEAFKMADNVLCMGVRGVTDLMVNPGMVNLDFADIRTVMAEMGKAMMGTGEAEGEDRARRAAESAISNPLLEDISMRGARGVLINITGGYDMTLFEVDGAANRIRYFSGRVESVKFLY
jgi:cell division protein FtsZ